MAEKRYISYTSIPIQGKKEARREFEDRLGDVYKLDAGEAISLAGMQNLDDAEEILCEWGTDI